MVTFLSTLSLRRATKRYWLAAHFKALFYPRSPCGERHITSAQAWIVYSFSIHALLAESDYRFCAACVPKNFSIHALLAESDSIGVLTLQSQTFSIHALLAESDVSQHSPSTVHTIFYPRSPCGERHIWATLTGQNTTFLSTLSLRRATAQRIAVMHDANFLSTLSLRRATPMTERMVAGFEIFYPRSPCGERQPRAGRCRGCGAFSIHALLAESDFNCLRQIGKPCVFLSTLSLRRATTAVKTGLAYHRLFYPRSPCGERLEHLSDLMCLCFFSIHALLAESDTCRSA